MISKILTLWTRIESVLIGLLILGALAAFLGGAALRAFAPAHAVDWAEEVALYGIVWATVIAGSSLLTEGRHIRTEIFLTAMTPAARAVVGWMMAALSIGFCIVMLIHGWKAFGFALMLDERSASTLRVQQGYAIFLALPVGMALMLGRAALMILNGRRPFTDDAPHIPGEN